MSAMKPTLYKVSYQIPISREVWLDSHPEDMTPEEQALAAAAVRRYRPRWRRRFGWWLGERLATFAYRLGWEPEEE